MTPSAANIKDIVMMTTFVFCIWKYKSKVLQHFFWNSNFCQFFLYFHWHSIHVLNRRLSNALTLGYSRIFFKLSEDLSCLNTSDKFNLRHCIIKFVEIEPFNDFDYHDILEPNFCQILLKFSAQSGKVIIMQNKVPIFQDFFKNQLNQNYFCWINFHIFLPVQRQVIIGISVNLF